MAVCVGIPAKKISAGTITTPPAMPKNPARMPAATPIVNISRYSPIFFCWFWPSSLPRLLPASRIDSPHVQRVPVNRWPRKAASLREVNLRNRSISTRAP